MNRKIIIFVGICLLLALSVQISRTGIVPMVAAGTAGDTSVFLPIIIKPSPPEYKIVFASDRDNSSGMYDIFIMNTDGTGIKNLTNTPTVAESYPTWSPDGTMIAYLSGEGSITEVFVMNSTGSDKHNVSNAPTANDWGLVWSPHSTQLAFLSDRDNVEGVDDIFVVNIDGTDLMNLTQSPDSDEWPFDWSRDGTKIVYTSDLSLQPGLIGQVVTMNADGSNKTTIVANSAAYWYPVWSPDGSKIAFILRDATSDCLALMNPDGTDQVCITSYYEIERVHGGFLWNSSASQILFEGLPVGSDQLDLFTVDVSDGNITNVTIGVPDFGSSDVKIDWSADDAQVVYNEEVLSQGHDIYIIDVDGSNHNDLTSSNNIDDRWPNWSPVPLP